MEAYAESLPQYFILTALAISRQAFTACTFAQSGWSMIHIVGVTHNATDTHHNYTCNDSYTKETLPLSETPFYNHNFMGESNVVAFFLEVPQYYWFRFTYYTTLISCAFGVVKFLDVGPTRCLVPEGWLNYIGYTCSCVSVYIALEKKALGLGTDGIILNSLLKTLNFCNQSNPYAHASNETGTYL